MTETAILAAMNVSRSFNSGAGTVRALDDVSLSLAAGETVGLVGESGSGKSTLARVLLRLIEPTSGTVTFRGRDLTSVAPRELRALRRNWQMVFQNPSGSLLPNATVIENVAESLRLHRVGDRSAQLRRALELMEMVGLTARQAESYPHMLSGGQQQRVSIARALALEPEVLICDEPTSALDVSIQAQILRLLLDLKHERQFTMLFITHNLAVVEALADRIVVMQSGQIVEEGSTAMLHAPKSDYTQTLLKSALRIGDKVAPA